MRRLMFLTIFAISFVLCSCGDDGDNKGVTPPDYDRQIRELQEQIDALKGKKPIEGATPVEQVRDRTGGLPPSGEPTGDPVDNPFRGVPVFGEGRIVFTVAGGGALYIMGSNGAGVELIVEDSISNPSLSPDGQSVAYSGFNGDSILVIRHIESGAVFNISPPGGRWYGFPAWSPDGEQIAYSDGSNIFIARVDPQNSDIVQITHDRTQNTNPTWSPDGEQIAFSSEFDGNSNIFAIGTDGRNRIRFTNHPGPEAHPDWSPDGEHIAFMGHRNNNTSWDIYLVNTSTFVETQLTDTQDDDVEPSWSPDGRKIAFERNSNDIYVVNADGTGLTNITNTPHKGERSPDW